MDDMFIPIVLLRFDSKEIGRQLVQRERFSFCMNGKAPIEKERFITKDIGFLVLLEAIILHRN